MVDFDPDSNAYSFPCPHCNFFVQVKKNDIACKIFRHGCYKKGMKNIPPHSSKEVCDRLVSENKIHGCGRPFKFDGRKVEKCGYI
jgi:hypothetical protein